MKTPNRHCKKKASPMDTQSATAIVERNELPLAVNLNKGNLTRFECPKLARFFQTQEEFAEVHSLSQSRKLWKHLLLFYRVYQEPPRNNEIYLKFATCFIYERFSAAKADPEAHKMAWALFTENVILILKRNPIAWKRKVDAFRDIHGPINVITTSDSMPGPSMQADVKGSPESCFMSFEIDKLHAKILDIQSNNKAKVLKNELKEKKAEFLNKRDALTHREATASAASMIQTEITSLQTRYGTLKRENATAEQLAGVEAQITAMSNAIKPIEGDDKIANMKIAVESIERDVNLLESKLSCSLHYMSFFENMMKQLANGCTLLLSPAFYALEEGRTNRADFYSDCVACGEPLAATNAIGVYMLPCGHKYHRWPDAEAAHHMSFETSRGYTENVVGVQEGNVFVDLGIASLGGVEKSWSDCKAAIAKQQRMLGMILSPLNQLYLVNILGGRRSCIGWRHGCRVCVFGGVCEEVQDWLLVSFWPETTVTVTGSGFDLAKLFWFWTGLWLDWLAVLVLDWSLVRLIQVLISFRFWTGLWLDWLAVLVLDWFWTGLWLDWLAILVLDWSLVRDICNWLVSGSGSGFLVLVRDNCNWLVSGSRLVRFLVLVRDSCNWLVSGSRLVSKSGSGLVSGSAVQVTGLELSLNIQRKLVTAVTGHWSGVVIEHSKKACTGLVQ
ncbi:hypothetical protein L7F22_030508 [Adiantum nelumboides]|nr:hypothetical protein [Adiantum nelumboides]